MSSTNPGPAQTQTNNGQSPFSNVTQLVNLSVNVGTLSGVAANTTAEQTVAVTGLAATDIVIGVSKPTAQAGLGMVGWRVAAAGSLGITFSNNTTASITPTASQTYSVLVARPVANAVAATSMPIL